MPGHRKSASYKFQIYILHVTHNDYQMSLTEILEEFNDVFWYIPLVLIVCLGIYSTIRLKGIQIRDVKEMFRVTFSKDRKSENTLSTIQVFCMSMGNRIGVGNITGPVLAILVGGPGAILWMWIFAALGMATSFVETTVGQIYKGRRSDGDYHGGPAYTIANGLGMKGLAMVVAVIMMLMYVVGFVSMEVCGMSEALCGAFEFEHNALFFAILLTALTAVIIAGGLKRIAKLSVFLVPLMALMWFIVAIGSIALSGSGIINAFAMIFGYAFTIPAAIGGVVGDMIVIGMRRGVLSNEAGIGTITNISSIADVSHPAKQGLSQSLGVLIDTIISTITALVILSYADIDTILDMGLESMPLLQMILADSFGSIAPYLVALFLFIFAFTSLMGDYVIGENNLMFAKDSKVSRYVMVVIILVTVFISSFYASDGMFAIVDILLGVCGVINTIVMFKLGGRAIEAYNDYRRQRSEGIEDPVFHKSALSCQDGITEWD